MLKWMNHWACSTSWSPICKRQFEENALSTLCIEPWASTNATEYQLNEAFEDLLKHLNWDILKDLKWFS